MRIFISERDGFVWTPLRVTSLLAHPHEDLRERLITAAKAEIPSRFLGTLLGPGVEVLNLVEAVRDIIY